MKLNNEIKQTGLIYSLSKSSMRSLENNLTDINAQLYSIELQIIGNEIINENKQYIIDQILNRIKNDIELVKTEIEQIRKNIQYGDGE